MKSCLCHARGQGRGSTPLLETQPECHEAPQAALQMSACCVWIWFHKLFEEACFHQIISQTRTAAGV